MSEHILVVCRNCHSVNRLPQSKLTAGGSCGSCRSPLFTGQPVQLATSDFQRFIQKNQLPVVVDYWASWCGPCKMMAPVFESVAAEMEPFVLFAKVNTETEPTLASAASIRSIPTLAIYQGGNEVARISGAMDAANLKSWIMSNTRK
jgi:thioredoxin 2